MYFDYLFIYILYDFYCLSYLTYQIGNELYGFYYLTI